MAGCPFNPPCPDDMPAGEINEEVNIAVLGSGFGGAVAAARLTEAGQTNRFEAVHAKKGIPLDMHKLAGAVRCTI